MIKGGIGLRIPRSSTEHAAHVTPAAPATQGALQEAKLDAAVHATAIVPSDVDNRRDVDLLVVSHDGAHRLFKNLRDGTFSDVAGDAVEWEFALNTEAEADQDNSITRHPDGNFLAPDPFVQHLSVADEPWSPATTIDGVLLLGGASAAIVPG